MNEREREIERARQAIEAAPKTESGIIIPPHVATAITEGVKLDEAAPRPNRAERRWQAKQERRRRSSEAQRARLTADQQKALSDAEKALNALPEAMLPAAQGMLKQFAAMTPEQRIEKLRELEQNSAA